MSSRKANRHRIDVGLKRDYPRSPQHRSSLRKVLIVVEHADPSPLQKIRITLLNEGGGRMPFYVGRLLAQGDYDAMYVSSLKHADAARFQSVRADGLRADLGVPGDAFLLLTVARVVPRKGRRLVLDALERIQRARYVTVGTGPEDERLKDRPSDRRVGPSICEVRKAAGQGNVASRFRYQWPVPSPFVPLPRLVRACPARIGMSEEVRDELQRGALVNALGVASASALATGVKAIQEVCEMRYVVGVPFLARELYEPHLAGWATAAVLLGVSVVYAAPLTGSLGYRLGPLAGTLLLYGALLTLI